MTEPRLGYAVRRALGQALRGQPDLVRHTLVIEATRRSAGGPLGVVVGIETVSESGQAVRRFGVADELDETDAPFTLALYDAVHDDPAARHQSDVLEWMKGRAAAVLRGDRRLW